MASPQKRKWYPMTAAVASEYVRRMIAREMRGPNDMGPAMNRIEQRFGIPFWSLDHLRKGKAKVCDVALFQRIRSAYLDHCERQLSALKHEIELEKARGNDCDQDLLAEAEALLAKIRERKG
jgi:hypothetical protein